MLRLGKQIGSNPSSIAIGGGEYNRLSGARRQIDGAIAADQLFGGGDVPVARAEDFLHARNRICAICESGNRLRSPNAGDLFNAE